jgi:predicted component of type VI protein secretion system
MIQFEIIKSPDRDIQKDFTFFHNEIFIGHSKGHVRINDDQLSSSHIMIEVIENELIIHPQSSVDHYLIDGKRATSVRKLRPGQSITIGETEFRIKDFKYTEFKTKKTILDEKLAHLIEQESSKLSIIEDLAGMMK